MSEVLECCLQIGEVRVLFGSGERCRYVCRPVLFLLLPFYCTFSNFMFSLPFSMALWSLMFISVLSNSTSVPTVCFSRRDERLSITFLSFRIDSSFILVYYIVNIYILRIP